MENSTWNLEMLRMLITSLCVAIFVTMMVTVVLQRNRIIALKSEQAQVLARIVETTQASLTASPPSARPGETNHSPPVELLRLRADFARLIARKNELAGVPAQSERLRSQVATRSTNSPGAVALPAGYIRKSAARFAGYNTPQDTLQSFLWAVHNRDEASLMKCFSPERAERLQNQLQTDESKTRFFDDINQMPGFLVTGQEVRDENSVTLQMQIGSGQGDPSSAIPFKRINGQWKLDSGL